METKPTQWKPIVGYNTKTEQRKPMQIYKSTITETKDVESYPKILKPIHSYGDTIQSYEIHSLTLKINPSYEI